MHNKRRNDACRVENILVRIVNDFSILHYSLEHGENTRGNLLYCVWIIYIVYI